jgi:hypothetical protein
MRPHDRVCTDNEILAELDLNRKECRLEAGEVRNVFGSLGKSSDGC